MTTFPAPRTFRQSASTTRLKAEQPGDLLGVLPYLLGYHPEESVVMAVVREKSIDVCVRIDLDAEPRPVVDRFVGIAEAHAADGVLLVAYSADPDRADRLLAPLIDGLDAGIGVIDALYADGRRWWSRTCRGSCCPTEGTPYEIDTSRLAAEAIYAGMSTLPTRSDIARQVDGPDPQTARRLEPLAERIAVEVLSEPVPVRRRWLRDFIGKYVRQRSRGRQVELEDEDLLRLGCLAVDLLVRDQAWSMITRESAAIHVELWQQVVTRAVSMLAPPALCLLGMAAWINGEGTLQVCCLERAREIDPDYTMTDVLADLNDRAVPPWMWNDLRPELCRALEDQAGAIAGGRRSGKPPDWSTPWSRKRQPRA